jgi:hypothetical protein
MLKEDQLNKSEELSLQHLKFRRCGDIKKTMIMLDEANNKQYYNDEWNQGNTNK